MSNRTPYTSTALEVLTSANLEKGPKGWLAYDTSTSTQSSITSEVAVTGLTETFTTGANRAIRYKCKIRGVSTVDQDNLRVRIKRDGTTVAAMDFELDTLGTDLYVEGHEIGPAAGTYTVTVTVQRSAGTGDVSLGTTTTDHWVLVEDMGPSS